MHNLLYHLNQLKMLLHDINNFWKNTSRKNEIVILKKYGLYVKNTVNIVHGKFNLCFDI